MFAEVADACGAVRSLVADLGASLPLAAEAETLGLDVVCALDRMAVLIQANDVLRQRLENVGRAIRRGETRDAAGPLAAQVRECAGLLTDVQVAFLDATSELDLGLALMRSSAVRLLERAAESGADSGGVERARAGLARAFARVGRARVESRVLPALSLASCRLRAVADDLEDEVGAVDGAQPHAFRRFEALVQQAEFLGGECACDL